MGSMLYGSWAVEFDDRLLTHLQIVIVNRLRRGEHVLMSWVDSVAVGDGRSSIWLTEAVPLYFKFTGAKVPSIDRAWIQRLDASAAASTGLIVTDADGAPLHAGPGETSLAQPRAALDGSGRR